MKGSLKRLIAVFMLFLHILSIAEPIVADKAKSPNLQVDKAANGVLFWSSKIVTVTSN